MKLSEKDGKKRGTFKVLLVTLFAIFALRICHYLIGDICNWMCVGSVTYSLVILLNRSALTSIAWFFFSSNHCVFLVLPIQKAFTPALLRFFCARSKYGCWVCCPSPRGAIHFKSTEGHRVQTQRMTAMAEMTGVQPRFWAGIGPALVQQIIWSETMRPEWQMIHFECDCTALRAQTKRARG